MPHDEIKKLAERVASGLATPDEIRLYNSLFNTLETPASADLPEHFDKEKIRDEILQSVHARISQRKPVLKMTWVKWAAAVLIFAATGSMVYLLATRKSKTEAGIVKTGSTPKIAAPGNKATLTMADGTVVMLDDDKSDSIVQQNGIKVLRLSKGVLSYEGNKKQGRQEEFNTISTPPGGQYQLVLEDGSQVWLNVASSLKFPAVFEGKDRVVELSGEAYFEVAHNANKPFRVRVNGMTVEVLGTHFNVNSYRDEALVKATLLEGKVKVHANNQQVMLNPRDQLVYNNTRQDIRKLENVNVDDVVAWIEGRFRFEDMSIEAIMRQVSRWYNVEVQYEGELTSELFSGDVSRQENLGQLLDILRATKMASFQLEGEKIIVKPLK